MLDFGAAAHEDLWHIDGERIRLRKLAPRLPITFYRFHVGEDGETLLALEQFGYRGNQFVNVVVPAWKVALFVHDLEGANWYGRSILRAAYQHWWFKSNAYKIYAIAIERNAMGIPTLKQAPNPSVQDRKNAETWAQRLATHENAYVSLPNGWEFEITGISGRILDPAAFIQHHSEMILRSVLADFLALGSTQTGSRAVGDVKRDFFLMSLEAAARNFCETMTATTIRRLVDYNFDIPPDRPELYPKLVCSNIAIINPLELAQAMKDLAAYGVDLIQPDDEVENWWRRKTGLPLKAQARPRFAPVQERETGTIPGSAPEEPGVKSPPPSGSQKPPKSLTAAESKPNRELKPFERKHDFAGHVKRADTTARNVARLLRQAKGPAIRTMAAHLAQLPVAHFDQAALSFDHELAARIANVLKPAHSFGHSQVHAERYRATGRARHVPAQSRATLAETKKRAKKGPEVRFVAEATVSDYTNWLTTRARGAAVDAAKDGLEGEELEKAVVTNLLEGSDSYLDRIAAEAARQAVAAGRDDAFQDLQTEIGSYVRSEVMDQNTCDPCAAGDGTTWNSYDEIDWSPGDDCEGGDACRGQIIPVFEDEGVAILE
jgi:hypothetical protein